MILASIERDKAGRCLLVRLTTVDEPRARASADFRELSTALGSALGSAIRLDLFPPAARHGNGWDAAVVVHFPQPCSAAKQHEIESTIGAVVREILR